MMAAKLTPYEQKIVELRRTHEEGMVALHGWWFQDELSGDYPTSCPCERCYLQMHPGPLAAAM